jgi:hypothetical protein
MLPYRLRPPVYGKTNEHLKRSQAQKATPQQPDGGPIQAAMVADLKGLQWKFLQSSCYSTESSNTEKHFARGRTFTDFKNLMEKSKVALMHLLIPQTTCDKEAYSQLIYAACLQVLKNSMEEENSEQTLESAAFSLFSLYALFETNPLSRQLDNSLDLLPMGLSEEEGNFRSLYRRAFKQNIRIDQYHYSLVLQVREMAMARIADCRKDFYLSRCSNEKQTLDSLWSCKCGIARDTLEILNRLESKWDYSAYTGPVGLEALAGHPEFHSLISSIAEEEEVRIIKSVQAEEYTVSNDLLTCIHKYHESIKSINVPEQKFRTASRLRNTLEAFFVSIQKEPWSKIEKRLFLKASVDDEGDSAENSGNSHIILQSNEADSPTQKRRKSNQSLEIRGFQKCSSENGNTISHIPAHHVVLPNNIVDDTGTKEHLSGALTEMFRREGPMLAAAKRQEEEEDKNRNHVSDDISSIGIGGISVATGRGRRALQVLLSRANKKRNNHNPFKIPTKVIASSSKQTKNDEFKNTAIALFLNADPNIPEDNNSEEDESGSNISNLSSDDDGDDYDMDDDVSIAATSAAGKQALEKLLSQVKKSSKNKGKKPNTARNQKASRKRSRTKIPPNVESKGNDRQENTQFDWLLSSNNKKVDDTCKRTNRKPKAGDTISCAGSSIGQGQGALISLLAQVGGRQDNITTKRRAGNMKVPGSVESNKRQRRLDSRSSSSSVKPTSQKREDTTDITNTATATSTDTMSCADKSIGQGQDALTNLLAQVGGLQNNITRKRRASKAKAPPDKRQRTLNSQLLLSSTKLTSQKEEDTNDVDDTATAVDAMSCAGSSIGQGQGALTSLLAQAGNKKDKKST